MYEDLYSRREQVTREVSGGDAGSVAKAAASQKNISNN